MPKISVIVPVYNAEKYLQRCVDSILAQTFVDFELLLINDGSKDGSGAICDEYAVKDSRIRVFHKENGGPSSARNMGIDKAEGEWITFVDSDDWVEKNAYEKIITQAEMQNPDIVLFDFKMIFNGGVQEYHFAMYNENKTILLQNYIKYVWTTLWAMMVKRDLFISNTLKLPEHLSYCEDFWLSIRLLHYAKSINYLPNALYCYNVTNCESIIHTLNRKTESEERKAYLETIEFFEKEGVEDLYKKEMSWRILKSTHDSALYPDRYNEFLRTHPESHKYIWSCPYVNFKSKCIMSLLRFRFTRPLGILLIRLRKSIR